MQSSKPAVYRKQPVDVVAVQLTAENASEIATWCGGDFTMVAGDPHIRIKTLEGNMYAKGGWWVIQGVEGEFYPCKDSVFRQTHTLVESHTASAMPPWHTN